MVLSASLLQEARFQPLSQIPRFPAHTCRRRWLGLACHGPRIRPPRCQFSQHQFSGAVLSSCPVPLIGVRPGQARSGQVHTWLAVLVSCIRGGRDRWTELALNACPLSHIPSIPHAAHTRRPFYVGKMSDISNTTIGLMSARAHTGTRSSSNPYSFLTTQTFSSPPRHK